MSLIDNLDRVAFSSNTQTDKIVAIYEGSFAPGSATTVGDPFLTQLQKFTFPHTFPRPVFIKMIISTDNSTWQDSGGISDAIAYSDSSEIGILTPLTTGTLWYKIIAFWIDDYDGSDPLVPSTTGSSSDVYFDSRLNYQKIAQFDVSTHGSGAGPESNVITHNLGYKPNTRVYFEAFAGQIWPANFGGTQNKWLMEFYQIECEYNINSTNVVINTYGGAASPTRRVWGIVYHDE